MCAHHVQTAVKYSIIFKCFIIRKRSSPLDVSDINMVQDMLGTATLLMPCSCTALHQLFELREGLIQYVDASGISLVTLPQIRRQSVLLYHPFWIPTDQC